MRKSGIGNVQFRLQFADDQAVGVGGQEQLHDAETWLGAHGGEHIGEFGDLIGVSCDGGRHSSIIAEIWAGVKLKNGEQNAFRRSWKLNRNKKPDESGRYLIYIRECKSQAAIPSALTRGLPEKHRCRPRLGDSAGIGSRVDASSHAIGRDDLNGGC